MGKSKRKVESYDLSVDSIVETMLQLRNANIVDHEVDEEKECVVFTVGEFEHSFDTSGMLMKGDYLQYWLKQPDMPQAGTDTWKYLSMMDKVAISAIGHAMEKGGTHLTVLLEHAAGKNTEQAAITVKDNNTGARFNIPQTVSELNKQKK